MINYRQDEAAERQAQVQRVNDKMVRVYFDHSTKKRTGMDGEKVTVYLSKFIEVETQETDALEIAKAAVIEAITAYDASSAVNEFFYQDKPMWLGREMRRTVNERIELDEKVGLATTKLINNGIVIELPIAIAKQFMIELSVYARDCYDKTEEHKAAINAMDSVSDVLNYDFTVGYPEKLHIQEPEQ